MKPLKAIAAMSLNRVIGNQGDIPWHLPEDFKWFKKQTLGNTLLMGRITWESIGKPLPNRRTIVLSRSKIELPEGVTLIHSLEQLTSVCTEDEQVWICGGAQLYKQTLENCSDLYLSIVHKEVEGDAFFPEHAHYFEESKRLFDAEGFHVIHYY